jgi:hypothetical protein
MQNGSKYVLVTWKKKLKIGSEETRQAGPNQTERTTKLEYYLVYIYKKKSGFRFFFVSFFLARFNLYSSSNLLLTKIMFSSSSNCLLLKLTN